MSEPGPGVLYALRKKYPEFNFVGRLVDGEKIVKALEDPDYARGLAEGTDAYYAVVVFGTRVPRSDGTDPGASIRHLLGRYGIVEMRGEKHFYERIPPFAEDFPFLLAREIIEQGTKRVWGNQ